MGIRDLIKKKDRLGDGDGAYSETLDRLAGPEFTFIRSDTNTQEIIYPPSHPPTSHGEQFLNANARDSTSKVRRSLDVFKPRSRGNSTSSVQGGDAAKKEKEMRRSLSHRLHLSRNHQATSEYVPENLPQISVTTDGQVDKDTQEREWEKRATILASASASKGRSPSASPSASPATELPALNFSNGPTPPRRPEGVVSTKKIDDDIQEAIRLHEDGNLDQSTRLFGRLADPRGANNPLSQVLYGLALRHGWGCEPDPERAVTYLSAAASNAALVETMALKAGLKKGGAAKGELVLAIFELANCFRHGWGIPRDPVAAKQYYETAANLGDSDAMNEVAWCYLEGFGCKKDKFASARYYRLAEQNGNKTLGNTW
ncbi:Uu.00g019490.m01.CDS01 [Anthostomella pinea]|uniref:Uu.00g019490.m01.CDS01 n=1 Tax=Anthostomella pinea TaxID=933095 RepID=A0AAI8W076_9PEZI|nr:Uu.00g019490.m01.CDS01 [Anthostomella pinea]